MKGTRVAALAASFAALAVAAPAASAANYSVTGTADGAPVACTTSGSDFSCPTLRSAVKAVNTAGGTNTITLPAGTYTLTNGPGTGQLVVSNGSVTVTGAGVGKTIIDGANATRIFDVADPPDDGVNLSIANVTLQHGAASGNWAGGGAIEDQAEGNVISVKDSTLDHNTATGNGGAIDAPFAGTVTVTDSTISNNTATNGNGGGIDASGLDMSGSTVNSNTATHGFGGGVYVTDVSAVFFTAGVHAKSLDNTNPSIVNSTIVANSTGAGDGNSGGGIFVAPFFFDNRPVLQSKAAHAAQVQPPGIPGFTSLAGDTIVGNWSVNSGGGNLESWGEGPFGAVFVQGTIIGGGNAGEGPSNCSLDSWVIDGGSNLVFTTNNCFDTLTNDIVTTSPGLETDPSGKFLLADNGGPTQTIALLPTSPAIDKVTDASSLLDAPVHAAVVIAPKPDCISDLLGFVLTTDQRGATRPDVSGTGCDIGAYETGAAPLVLTGSVTPNPGAIGKPINYMFTATNNGPSFGTHSTFHATLPSGVTFNSATPSQGSCTQTSATTVDCALGVIPVGTASVAIALTPNSAGTYAVTGTASDRESGASAPLTLSANVPATVSGTTTTAASIIAPKPSTQVHACVSRRHFPIHLQNLGKLHIASATVYLNSLELFTLRGKHLTAPIDLRSLPQGTFTVTIVAHQFNGHVLRGKRTYHTCSVKLAGHKHLYL